MKNRLLRTRPFLYRVVFLSFVALLFASCGETGQGPKDKETEAPEFENVTRLNPEDLEGVLYFEHYSRFGLFDFETEHTYTWRTTGTIATANDAGNLFVDYDRTGSGYGNDRLYTFDNNGLTEFNFILLESIQGRIKMSPDGQYFAFHYDQDNSDWEGLVILNRQGQIVRSIRDNDAEELTVMTWEWLPNNNIALVFGGVLLEYVEWWAPGDPNIIPLGEIPFQAVNGLAVSPQGDRFLFNAESDVDGQTHVYLFDVDSQNITQVTDSDTHEFGADFSPDGKHIAFRQGENYVWCGDWDVQCFTDCSTVFVAPVTAVKGFASDDERNELTEIRHFFNGKETDICAREQLDWRARPETLNDSTGVAFSTDELNAGLSGTLVFRQSTLGIVKLNVATGAIVRMPIGTEYPTGISANHATQEVAHRESSHEHEGYTDHVIFRDYSGTKKDIVSLTDNMSGTAKISPNGEYVAIEWHDYTYGDDGGTSVINIVRRNSPIAGYEDIVARFVDFGRYAWTPDNRLLLTRSGEVHITNAAYTSTQHLFSVNGYIKQIEVNPDGTEIAFALNSHIWTAPLEDAGGEVIVPLQLTTSAMEETNMTYSPEGDFLAVVYETNDECEHLQIVPSDGQKVYIDTDKLSARSMELNAYDFDNGVLSKVCIYEGNGLAWVP